MITGCSNMLPCVRSREGSCREENARDFAFFAGFTAGVAATFAALLVTHFVSKGGFAW